MSTALRDIARYVAGGALASAVESVVAPPRQPRTPLLPPPPLAGPLIGGVWSALFAAMGLARQRLRGHPEEQRLIDALWLLCVTYPLYSGGMRRRGAAYAGNAAVGVGAALVASRVARVRPDAALLLLPILPWVTLATLALATERPRAA